MTSNNPNASFRNLEDYVNTPRAAGRSHLRSAAQRAAPPPGTSYMRKLAMFVPNQLWGWITNYLKFRFSRKHRFQNYKEGSDKGIYSLSGDSAFSSTPDPGDEVRISIAGDWGTGTDESSRVAAAMMDFDPHYTIHLGDVYFVGDKADIQQNCLGQPEGPGSPGVYWPMGTVGSFSLNSNHEMYANGDGYFDYFLPTLGLRPTEGAAPTGQRASFFCLQNDWWNIIALDTGYNSIGLPLIELVFTPSCKQVQDVLDWLENTVQLQNDRKRGLIILSHHQYYSSFDQMYPQTAQQLTQFVHRPVLWFWGHEHRMAVYGRNSVKNGIEAYGRCVGHGGMPVDINMEVKSGAANVPLVLYDNRQYEKFDKNHAGLNGFVNLTFKKDELTVEYLDINKESLLQETWQVTEGGILAGKDIQAKNSDGAIIRPRDLKVAIGSA